MKTITKQFLACMPIIVLALAINSPASAQNPIKGQGELQRDIAWLYDSPLTVYEEIVDLGDGAYSYSYSFLNVDDKHLWHFGVFVVFPIDGAFHTWESLPEWEMDIFQVAGLTPEYDPINLNPDLLTGANTWGPGWPNTTHPISPGDYVEGFTFIAYSYDPSPKLFFYETVEDGYAVDTDFIAAIGYTQSGPVAVEPTKWGEVKALYR